MLLAEGPQLQVGRPKVVAPRADAVSLVNREQADQSPAKKSKQCEIKQEELHLCVEWIHPGYIGGGGGDDDEQQKCRHESSSE